MSARHGVVTVLNPNGGVASEAQGKQGASVQKLRPTYSRASPVELKAERGDFAYAIATTPVALRHSGNGRCR